MKQDPFSVPRTDIQLFRRWDDDGWIVTRGTGRVSVVTAPSDTETLLAQIVAATHPCQLHFKKGTMKRSSRSERREKKTHHETSL